MSTHQVTLSSPSDMELLVDFNYQPYEPPERGPEAQYPGCAEAVEIEHVTLNGHNITSMLSEAQLQSIEDDVLSYIHDLRPDYSDLEPF